MMLNKINEVIKALLFLTLIGSILFLDLIASDVILREEPLSPEESQDPEAQEICLSLQIKGIKDVLPAIVQDLTKLENKEV